MKEIVTRPYTDSHADAWDAFLAHCPMATFLHSRKFLSHHGDKFTDGSLMFFDETEKLCGVLPAAELTCQTQFFSHPGATFSGLCHRGNLTANDMDKIITAACRYYKQKIFLELVYKPVPHIYHLHPAENDKAEMFARGAMLECRLSVAINLAARRKISSSRRQGYKTAFISAMTCGIFPPPIK